MLTKDQIRKSLDQLPNSFTIDELIERLMFIEKVEAGLDQAKKGKTIPQNKVKELIEKWSK